MIRFAREALPLEATPVDNLFIIEHMPGAGCNQLRVYLYGLMLCRYPAFGAEGMGDALGLSAAEVLDAFAYWQREGLLRILSADPLEVEYIAPSQRPTEPMLVPGKYQALVQAAQQLFAPRMLRANELRLLYDWVEVFGLSEDAVLELLSYCIHRKGAGVHAKYMDTVASAWAREGVKSAQDARDYIAAYEEKTGGAASVLRRWNKDRRPTQDELDLYEKWTKGWGFTPEAVLAACPEVTKADKPSFGYLDSLLERLYRGGNVTVQGITALIESQEADAALAREVFAKLGMGRGARPLERAELAGYMQAGFEKEALLLAAEYVKDRERPLAGFKALVKELADSANLTAVLAAKYLEGRAQKKPADKKKPSALDYEQKRYSTEDIAHIFVNLDEEGKA